LEATGAAWVLEESQVTPEALAGLLAQAFAHLEALPAKGAQGKALARPQAAQEIAQLVLRLGRRSTGEAA